MNDIARIDRSTRIMELHRMGLSPQEIAAKYDMTHTQVRIAIRHGAAPARVMRETRKYQIREAR